MISTHKDRTYGTKRIKVGDRYRTDFVLHCSRCSSEETIHMDPNCKPDLIVQKFNRLGWKVDERNAAKNICPLCQIPKQVPMPKPEENVMADLPKGPTHEQRKRIAQSLRGLFDEQRGCYLDGHTDQTVAQDLQMPWAWIRECRDLLGYEIKIDPEIEALRSEFATLADMLVAAEAKLAALEKKRLAS